MGLDLRGVDVQRNVAADLHTNRAGIEGQGNRSTGFQNGKMRGPANAYVTAFDQIDPRLPGLYPNIAAAAQNCPHQAVDDFDSHAPFYGDGFAFDRTYGVGWLVFS